MARKKKKKKVLRTAEYHAEPRSERELMEDLNEDLHDAWEKLRAYCAGLGEQRIYTSAKAIMFARKRCYLFVRPKKAYVEVSFFLAREVRPPAVFRCDSRSKTKFAHTYKLVHADQIEEPLTDWIQEAFSESK